MRITAAQVKQLHAEVVNQTEDAKQALLWRSAALSESMAFYRGRQWGVPTAFGWYIQDQLGHEAREVYNYIRPTVKSWVGMMLRNMPNPSVVSGFSDSRTMVRAMNTQRLARAMIRNGTINFEELRRGETKTAIHGACWYKVYFDPNAGKASRVPKYITTPAGAYVPDTDNLGAQRWWNKFEGQIKVEYRDIVDVIADPHATKEEEIRYVVERKLIPVSTMDDIYPLDAFGQPTMGRWDMDSRETEMHERDSVENEHRSYDGSVGGAYSGRAHGNQLVRFNIYWMRPTNQHPEGMLLAWSGDVIVAISTLPYEWPWVLRCGTNVVPNSLYPDGLVEDLKPIQRTINLNASKRREWTNTILNPPLLVSSDSNIRADDFSDIAGDVIIYEGTARTPEWMNVPNIPQSMFTQEDHLVAILKDVSGISDISRGEAPPGIETGRALAYLHEFQQGVHEPDVQAFQATMKAIIRKCVKLARDFYQEGRLIAMVGDNNAWEMKAFERDEYDLDAELEIELQSGAPNSRALRLQEAMEIFQVGGYADTPEAQKFRKVANIDFVDRAAVDPSELHRSRARNEQLMLQTDPTVLPQVLEQDDHEIHLEEHGDFRVSAEYFELPHAARMAMDEHVAQHEMAFAMQQGAYAQQQQTMGQTAAGPPPAAQPQLESPGDPGGLTDATGNMPEVPAPPGLQ